MAGDNINVFVRVRPYNEKEPANSFIDKLTATNIHCRDRERESDHEFAFDQIFNAEATQEEVFQKVGVPAVESAFQGFNGTIFAYGQTSSGKTHTCIGPDYENQEMMGILPRLICRIFEKIKQAPPCLQFRIKLTMVEIYMQKIKDLLDTTRNDVKIRESKAKGIYMQDVTQQYVISPAEAFSLLKKGLANRAVGSTNMNEGSSRSHMAFIITIHQSDLKDSSAKSGRITLVDLAGSEKVSKSHAEGKLLDQAKQINKSLSCLGNVINALTESKATFVPYRDSKLTRLLQESLGGNSKTNLIINISPSTYNAAQSISSLRFGFRAKQIKNKPKINRQYTIAELLLLLQKAERRIKQLESLLKDNPNSKIKMALLHKADGEDNLLDEEPQPPVINKVDAVAEAEAKISMSPKQLEPQKMSLTNFAQPDPHIKKLENQLTLKDEQLALLTEEIHSIHEDKTQLERDLAIMTERHDCVMKEIRLGGHKLAALAKQNEHLLIRLTRESITRQELEDKNKVLQKKVEQNEEDVIGLGEIQKKNAKTSSVFGTNKELSSEIERLYLKVINERKKQESEAMDSEIHEEKKQLVDVGKLKEQLKNYEQELNLYKHLESQKESLVQEKLRFMAQRDQIHKDLENRVQKVLILQEKVDFLNDKIKYLNEIIQMDESDKARKILSLQNKYDELSRNFYVLKGLQNSWISNTRQAEAKLFKKKEIFSKLERQNMELKMEVQQLTLKCQELEAENEIQKSVLDVSFEREGDLYATNARMVKVLRSEVM